MTYRALRPDEIPFETRMEDRFIRNEQRLYALESRRLPTLTAPQVGEDAHEVLSRFVNEVNAFAEAWNDTHAPGCLCERASCLGSSLASRGPGRLEPDT